MKKNFTFLLGVFFASVVMAQVPTAVFKKATVAPVIDGVVDVVWADAPLNNIDKPFQLEVPTLGTSGQTTWQALWNADGVYVLLKVTDDAFYPNYAVTPAGNNWEYDKPEIYFDVNYVLEDGLGAGNGQGHIQVAPGFTDGKNDGTAITDNQVVYAFLVTGSNYIAEYFIPFTRLVDKGGIEVDKFNTIGFDVTIIDRDPSDAARKRAVWANVGAIAESYANMNDAGHVTFEGADAVIYVDAITVTGGTITTDNGTLQMTAAILPVDATNQKLKWTVTNETGKASINATTGLLTGITNGTVTVVAASVDGGYTESAPVTVTISGQIVDETDIWNSFNLIRNWNFTTDLTGWGGWVDAGGMAQPTAAPVIEEGVVVMKAGLAADGAAWHYQHNQNGLQALPNVPYTLKFKSWASGNAPAVVDFEDIPGNNYNRYGASSDPGAVGGRSEWNYSLTTDPTWYEFHVVFDQIVANTDQKVQWMLSLSNETIYLDSVLLINDDELSTRIKPISSNSMRVYPNPIGAGNELNVSLSAANVKVAIYNAVGQKLMEKVANGNLAKFNVSSLRKGMYFVRLSDGTSQKFIR